MQKILSSRIPYIDALRGFAILLVIAGHVIQTLYGTDGLVFRYIYSFHMPLFVFLSGFVSYKIETWKSVGKRFLQLIVPFFCYNVITFFQLVLPEFRCVILWNLIYALSYVPI